MKQRWFAITLIPNSPDDLSSDELDSLCAELIDIGAKGTAVDTPPEIVCYLEGTTDSVDSFIAALDTLPCNVPPLKVVSINTVADENWTGACPEIWDTVTAGSLIVAPVESLNDHRPTPPNAIRIIPGLGFGTGHHATTKMVLEELSEIAIRLKQGVLVDTKPSFPERIFDLGTGSGILAIAAAKLFNAPIDANEIDPAALDNARDNIELNQVAHSIELSLNPLEKITHSYDLLLANLYGEVLIKLAPEITRITRPGAYAILSGITELVWDQVLAAFQEQAPWRVVKERGEGSWSCAVLFLPHKV